MSAAVGLIDTAPCDQLEAANVSAIGTLGAPARLLPTPLTPGFAVSELRTLHCETWGPGTVGVILPAIAKVSSTMPFTRLSTSSCEFVPASPSPETQVPKG